MKIRDRSSKGHRVVGVCYKPPDQGEPVDEAFLRQLDGVSRSWALVLKGDFSHPDVKSESVVSALNTEKGNRSRELSCNISLETADVERKNTIYLLVTYFRNIVTELPNKYFLTKLQ